MLGRLRQREHRREAGVGALQQLAPLVAGAPADHRGELFLEVGPAGAVVLPVPLRAVETQPLAQLGVELGLDRTQRDVAAVGGLVHVVVVGAGVEHVGAPLLGPEAGVGHAEEGGHQRGGAVHHGRVDHLALPGAAGLDQRARHPEGQVHAAAAEVADQVERRDRGVALASDAVQGAGQGDVVEVVAGGGGVGSVLAPAGHAAVDEARVAGQAVVGADAEPLGHAGPEPLQQCVGAVNQGKDRLDALGRLEVDADRAAPSVEQVERRTLRVAAAHRRGPVHPDHVGAHVGQHHCAERPRPDPRDLDNPYPRQRSHAVPFLVLCSLVYLASAPIGQVTRSRRTSPPAASSILSPGRCGASRTHEPGSARGTLRSLPARLAACDAEQP